MLREEGGKGACKERKEGRGHVKRGFHVTISI